MTTARVLALVLLALPALSSAARDGGDGGTTRGSSPQEVYSRDELKRGIAHFYDKSSPLWERIWGEHMHHGYYPPGTPASKLPEHRQAQVDMIEAVLAWAGVGAGRGAAPKRVLDVGCGIGGSTRHLVSKFDKCEGTGVTLSPGQAARARQLSAERGLGGRASFQVADALSLPFDDGSFDLIWSLESGEHMPDKPRFVGELARVCAKGGRVIIVTWCHRDLAPGEAELSKKEQRLLGLINRAYYLPAWCSARDYEELLAAEGLVDISRADWTDAIEPFWRAVIRTALTPRGLLGLLRAGPSTLRGALVMPLMQRGYKRGLIKFALITAHKPAKGGRPPKRG